MQENSIALVARIAPGGAGLEALGAVLSAAFTFGLFMAVAHFEAKEPDEMPPDIVEMRALSIPMDTPPPRPTEAPPVASAASPFAGLAIGSTESNVKIAVIPADLEQFVPTSSSAPAASIQLSKLYTEFSPQMNLSADFSRVFQQSEVDQQPTVLSRPNPVIPTMVRRGADALRVVMLIVVNENGAVESVRALEASDNPEFDAIILRDIREAWLFTPAIRKGRKVKCLLQQSVRVNWSGNRLPFET